MATKSSTSGSSGSSSSTRVFDEAAETFNEAVTAGVKVQEEIGKWWSDALEQAGGGGEQWQKKSRAILDQAIPAAQRNAQEWLKLVDQNYRRSLGLFRKAWEVQPADPGEMRAKSQELWEESLELVRDNAKAVAEANVKLMEVWGRVLQNGAAVGNGKSKK